MTAQPNLEAVERLEWRCFHCDEVFTDRRCAAAHFGSREDRNPACQIKMGGERSLLEALRRAEDDLSAVWDTIHAENTEAAKAYYAQQTRHREQLIATEQVGYERGLQDAQTHPETLGLAPIFTLRSQAEALERLEALRPVLVEYDALLATCPLSSRNPVIRASARDICPVCRNGPDGSCGRDNPWQLVESVRAALTPELKS